MSFIFHSFRPTKRTAVTAAFLAVALVFGLRIFHYARVADVEPEVVKSLPMQIEADGIRLIRIVAGGEFEIQARRAQPGQEFKLGPKSKAGAFVALDQVRATFRRQGMELWTARGSSARLSKDRLEFVKPAVVEPVNGQSQSYRRLRISLDTGRISGER